MSIKANSRPIYKEKSDDVKLSAMNLRLKKKDTSLFPNKKSASSPVIAYRFFKKYLYI
jgi:hypothetical protein